MLLTGGRHPFLGKWRVGFTCQGKLTALQIHLYSNGGCTQDVSTLVMKKALFNATGPYRFLQTKSIAYLPNLSMNKLRFICGLDGVY